MIVVLLIVIWGVALVPVTMRWLSERQLATSVTRFMSARRLLRRTYPLLAVVGPEHGVGARVERLRPESYDEGVRRSQRERAQRRIERRRRVLSWLVGSTGFTVAVGALPPLHLLWIFSVLGLTLIGAYVALLAKIAQREATSAPRHRPSSAIPRARLEPSPSLLVANGQAQPSTTRPPYRPAFVLVDAPS